MKVVAHHCSDARCPLLGRASEEWVVHAHLLAVLSGGSTVHTSRLRLDGCFALNQRPLGRIASMPATGHNRTIAE
jgi:hypothetical protein